VPWAAALAGAALAVPSPAASQVAVLQALDKETARL
jgi:hypothetical protein